MFFDPAPQRGIQGHLHRQYRQRVHGSHFGRQGVMVGMWSWKTLAIGCHCHMAMDEYLLIPFLGGWTSIYQLFWCEQKGYKVLTHCHMLSFVATTVYPRLSTTFFTNKPYPWFLPVWFARWNAQMRGAQGQACHLSKLKTLYSYLVIRKIVGHKYRNLNSFSIKKAKRSRFSIETSPEYPMSPTFTWSRFQVKRIQGFHPALPVSGPDSLRHFTRHAIERRPLGDQAKNKPMNGVWCSYRMLHQWEISRILKWRYVSTIFLAIFCGDIPWN